MPSGRKKPSKWDFFLFFAFDGNAFFRQTDRHVDRRTDEQSGWKKCSSSFLFIYWTSSVIPTFHSQFLHHIMQKINPTKHLICFPYIWLCWRHQALTTQYARQVIQDHFKQLCGSIRMTSTQTCDQNCNFSSIFEKKYILKL